MSKPIKAILFDLGKVIVDFDFTPAFSRLSRHCALKPHEISDYFTKSGLEVLYDGGKISSKEFHRVVKKSLGHSLDYDGFKKIWNEIFKANAETVRLIQKLKKNYRLVLLSNTNAMHFEYILKKYKILGAFDAHILSYKEKLRKPDERLYRIASRACKAKPHEILYIDDREDLTEAARDLGFHTHTFKKDYPKLRSKMKALKII